MPRVSICVGTYRRPRELRRLLEALARLRFVKVGPPDIEIVVVDNSPDEEGRAVCDAARDLLRWRLRYEREEQPGISYVRNRAVRLAAPASDFVAFIDDDEEPEPQWLDELLAVQPEHAADLVAGPVLPRFEGHAPDWIVRGKFFDLPRHSTGAPIQHSGTGNVLIRAEILRGMVEPFDPRMALLGGEDTLFFLRAHRAGRKMVWCDEALVHEWIPPDRTRAGWLLRRSFRKGNTWSLCEREIWPSVFVAAARFMKGIVRIGQGLALLPINMFRGRIGVIEAANRIAVGAGNVAGVVGVRFQEYRVKEDR